MLVVNELLMLKLPLKDKGNNWQHEAHAAWWHIQETTRFFKAVYFTSQPVASTASRARITGGAVLSTSSTACSCGGGGHGCCTGVWLGF
jgi:hypothetical protein